MSRIKAAILGTVGVPANYGGFETLAENLVAYHDDAGCPLDLTVYCSSRALENRRGTYRGARLRYVNLEANGISSIAYDIIGLLDAIRRRQDRILLLGVSGAVILPLIRLISSARIITNVDGIEWKREKWTGIAKHYLRFAENLAVKASHEVIADNQAIADYLAQTYGCDAHVIPYGGDHAVETPASAGAADHLPKQYALGLCRIEPENNIDMILEAFDGLDMPLVFVGNWNNSEYGRALKARYDEHDTIAIHDPVYDAGALRAIRDRATLYVHGHSAGGTNPALVEMMHFGVAIAAHGCAFNRHTTEGQALYFESAEELAQLVRGLTASQQAAVGGVMADVARRRYTWSQIGRSYLKLLDR